MDFHTEGSGHDAQALLRPLRLLALGAKEPDWNFLSERLSRQNWDLKEANWNPVLFQTLQALRTEHWDCLVISLFDEDENFSHGELASFLAAIRESGLSIAISVLACSFDVELAQMFQKYDCDFHEIRAGWFSPVTGVLIDRAMQLQVMMQEYKKLQRKEEHRNLREREEAEVILTHQRTLLQEILKEQKRADQFSANTSPDSTLPSDAIRRVSSANASLGIPTEVDPQYEQTLRSFVIMGSGRLESELSQLVESMQSRGCTPQDLLAMHLGCVEKLIEGLGQRSSRHVVQRSDQMLLEMMVHLAENYRSDAA